MVDEHVNPSPDAVNHESALGNVWAVKAILDGLAAALAQGMDLDEGLAPALKHASGLLDAPAIALTNMT